MLLVGVGTLGATKRPSDFSLSDLRTLALQGEVERPSSFQLLRLARTGSGSIALLGLQPVGKHGNYSSRVH